MQGLLWLGEIVVFVVGAFSLLWMIAAGFVLVLKLLLRNEYTVKGGSGPINPGSTTMRIVYRS
jgi:hypothetical protein